jgi:hypothetical protein
MARHAVLWKWDCNVTKSVCMAFGPRPVPPPPLQRWRRQRQLHHGYWTGQGWRYLQLTAHGRGSVNTPASGLTRCTTITEAVLVTAASARAGYKHLSTHLSNRWLALWDGDVGWRWRRIFLSTGAFAGLEEVAHTLRGALACRKGAGGQHNCRSATATEPPVYALC